MPGVVLTEFGDLAERMVTHTRRYALSLVALGEALHDLTGVVTVACLQLPPDVAEALVDKLTKVAGRADNMREATEEMSKDTLALIETYQQILLERLRWGS